MFFESIDGQKSYHKLIKLDPISFRSPTRHPLTAPYAQTTPYPGLSAATSLPSARHRRSSYPTHPPLRARPMADAVRPLSTGSVETSDGNQPPSWIPHPSATRPVPPSHATGHSAFSKRCPFLLAGQRALLRVQRSGPSPRDDDNN